MKKRYRTALQALFVVGLLLLVNEVAHARWARRGGGANQGADNMLQVCKDGIQMGVAARFNIAAPIIVNVALDAGPTVTDSLKFHLDFLPPILPEEFPPDFPHFNYAGYATFRWADEGVMAKTDDTVMLDEQKEWHDNWEYIVEDCFLALPRTSISPNGLTSMQSRNKRTRAILTVANAGNAGAKWMLREDALTRDFNMVLDGGFEDASGFWESGGIFPVCDDPSASNYCASGGAHSGEAWLQFTSADGSSTSSINQLVEVRSAQRTLSFYLRIPEAQDRGSMEVLLDGTPLFTVSQADAAQYAGYILVDVAVPERFADGQQHTLEFSATITDNDPSGSTTFSVDTVQLLYEHEYGTCGGPIPWASLDHTEGTVGADASTAVNVTFDSTGLTPGIYRDTLCFYSSDLDHPVIEVPLTLTVPGVYLPLVVR